MWSVVALKGFSSKEMYERFARSKKVGCDELAALNEASVRRGSAVAVPRFYYF